MSEYKKNRALQHKVRHRFSGKVHFFEVENEKGDKHSVGIQVTCDCRYMGVQGIARGDVCSHIVAVCRKVADKGKIQ